MNISELKYFFLWCAALNYGILLAWFGIFCLSHDWLYQLHTRWFKLSPENFDALHYLSMAIYKMGVLLFNVIPLLVLIILT